MRKALRLPIGANYHGHKADEELSGWQVAKTLVDGRLGFNKKCWMEICPPPFWLKINLNINTPLKMPYQGIM